MVRWSVLAVLLLGCAAPGVAVDGAGGSAPAGEDVGEAARAFEGETICTQGCAAFAGAGCLAIVEQCKHSNIATAKGYTTDCPYAHGLACGGLPYFHECCDECRRFASHLR
jgi:hypothetical protein